MACLRYLRDVFIVLGLLLIIAGILVSWAVVAVFALGLTYVATFITDYRPSWLRKRP